MNGVSVISGAFNLQLGFAGTYCCLKATSPNLVIIPVQLYSLGVVMLEIVILLNNLINALPQIPSLANFRLTVHNHLNFLSLFVVVPALLLGLFFSLALLLKLSFHF